MMHIKGSAVVHTARQSLARQITPKVALARPSGSKIAYTTGRAGTSSKLNNDNNTQNGVTSTPLLRVQPTHGDNSRVLQALGQVRFNSAAVARHEERAAEEFMLGDKTTSHNERMLQLKRKGDLIGVQQEYARMKALGVPMNHHTYNLVIDAYSRLRKDGTPLNYLMEVFQDMIHSGFRPDTFTYSQLIKTLCRRDTEVQKAILLLKRKAERDGTVVPAKEIAALEAEENVQNAMALFESAVRSNRSQRMDLDVYNYLLRTLSFHADAKDGLYVLEQLEASETTRPNAHTFAALISLYGRAGDLPASLECFEEYKTLRKTLVEDDASQVYKSLVDAYIKCNDFQGALTVLEQTMKKDGVKSTIAGYNTIIRALCNQEDLAGALKVVRRLETTPDLPKPDSSTYGSLLSLIHKTYFEIPEKFSDEIHAQAHDIYQAMRGIDLSRAYGNLAMYALLCVDAKLYPRVFTVLNDMKRYKLVPDATLSQRFVTSAVASGDSKLAIDAFKIVAEGLDVSRGPSQAKDAARGLSSLVVPVLETCKDWQTTTDFLPIITRHQLANVNTKIATAIVRHWLPYIEQRHAVNIDLKSDVAVQREYASLLEAALLANLPATDFSRIATLLLDEMKSKDIQPTRMVAQQVANKLSQNQDTVAATQWMGQTVVASRAPTSLPEGVAPASPPESFASLPAIKILNANDARADVIHRAVKEARLDDVASIIQTQFLPEGVVPSCLQLSGFFKALIKSNDAQAALDVYHALLPAYESSPKRRSAIAQLLNAMLTLHAQRGDLANAKTYHAELLKRKIPISNDAYANLLLAQTTSDMTDDAADALLIHKEARNANGKLNTYLYNVIISKLAKARKTDQAIAMYEEMQQSGVHATSVTFGALISACVRAGNEAGAKKYFDQMMNTRGYEPRIAPLNHMMQLYVRDLKDRTTALHYFDTISASKLRPTAHSIRLLLEAWAHVEPYDLPTAHQLLGRMKSRFGVDPDGTHYATLIHAYGTLQKDVDSALKVLKEMHSKGIAAEESVFQSLVEMWVNHGDVERAERVVKQMERGDVGTSTPQAPLPRTIHIQNALMRGYGAAGEQGLAKAEAMFNAMSDTVPETEGVLQRGPTTYETMIQLYLDQGHRDKASTVLEQMRQRSYPDTIMAQAEALLK